jgi:glycosyltransferase involved in cell wall biosynthesis
MRLSVVIPCHDSAAFVEETAQSVLAQTAADYEVIFVDDGSRDGTRAVIERFIGLHPQQRLRLLCQPNAGVAAARNRGVAEARGCYVLPLDADDLISPSLLQQGADVLDSAADVAVVFTDRRDFGEVDRVWTAGRFELARLKYFNQIGSCSLFRKSMWERLGGYRTNVDGFDDWDFWLAAAAAGFRGHHLAAPLCQHRRRPGSFLTRILRDYESLYARIILNHPAVYSASELAAATRFLSTGEPAALLSSSRLLFQRHLLEQSS